MSQSLVITLAERGNPRHILGFYDASRAIPGGPSNSRISAPPARPLATFGPRTPRKPSGSR
jgi:hypothetical protein